MKERIVFSLEIFACSSPTNIFINQYLIIYSISKYFKILSFIIKAFLIIITLFFNYLYPLLISYAIGAIASLVLFYMTHKIVNQTYYTGYKKMMKRIHIMHQVTYVVIYVLLTVIFESVIPIVGVTLGFLIIKISSLLTRLSINK